MRTVSAALAAFVAIAMSFSAANADGSLTKFYPFERATIKYALSGLQTGTQTSYIKEWGAVQTQLVDSNISMMGFERPFKSRIISTPEWVYNIDLVTNTGTRIANPMTSVFTSGENDPEVIAERMMASLGASKVGEDSYGGEDCTIWEIPAASTRMCLRDDNVLAYTRTNVMGQTMEINLVSFEAGDVDEEYFVIPDMEYSEPPTGMQFPGMP